MSKGSKIRGKALNEDVLDVVIDEVDEKDINSTMESNQPATTGIITPGIEEQVIKYVGIDNAIRDMEKELRTLKTQRKPKEDYILEFFEKKNADTIEISDGVIKKNKVESKGSVTVEIVKDALSGIVKNEDVITKVLEKIEELRKKTVKINLKRVQK